jgi:2,5-diketo-D-gluconate reductase B
MAIAAAHGCDPAQVSLAFLIAEGLIVIPASGNPGRMRSNFAATGITLTPHDIEQIRQCECGGRMIRPNAPVWDA